MVYLSKKLATINTQVEIKCSLDDMVFEYPIDKKALEIMKKLEFRNLINRFEYRFEEDKEKIQSPQIETQEIKTAEELECVVKSIEKGQKIVINWGENVIIAVCGKEYSVSISNDLFGEGLEPYTVAEIFARAVWRRLY